MIEKIYNDKGIDLMYDIHEDLVYIKVTGLFGEACTMDYTKQELVAILKDMINVLDN